MLIHGKDSTEGLEHTLTAEKMYSINFIVTKKCFLSVCTIMEQIATHLLMVKKL